MAVPVSCPGLAGSAGRPQHLEQGEPDRHLQQEREAAGGGVDTPLLVQRHHLLLHLFLVVLVLLLDPLDLRLDLLHRLHRPGLLQRQREEKETDHKSQEYDCDAVVGDDVVEEGEDRASALTRAVNGFIAPPRQRRPDAGERRGAPGRSRPHGTDGNDRSARWRASTRDDAVPADRLGGVFRTGGEVTAATGRGWGHPPLVGADQAERDSTHRPLPSRSILHRPCLQ